MKYNKNERGAKNTPEKQQKRAFSQKKNRGAAFGKAALSHEDGKEIKKEIKEGGKVNRKENKGKKKSERAMDKRAFSPARLSPSRVKRCAISVR